MHAVTGQVMLELLRCFMRDGPQTWRSATINGEPIAMTDSLCELWLANSKMHGREGQNEGKGKPSGKKKAEGTEKASTKKAADVDPVQEDAMPPSGIAMVSRAQPVIQGASHVQHPMKGMCSILSRSSSSRTTSSFPRIVVPPSACLNSMRYGAT